MPRPSHPFTLLGLWLAVLSVATATATLAQSETSIPYRDGGSVTLSIPDRPAALAIGRPAPPLSGTDLDGAPADVPTRRAVYFFSHAACGLCDEALAELSAGDFRLKRRADLVYVDLYDDAAELRAHLSQTASAQLDAGDFDVLVADEATFEALPLARFPTVVVVDRRGRIEEIREGYEVGVFSELLR